MRLPISVDFSQFALDSLDIVNTLRTGGDLQVEFDGVTQVATPFGTVDLLVDEAGDIRVVMD